MAHKRQDVELLRIISTFLIVWFHTGVVGHEISYSGLVVFLILSMYLSGTNSPDGDFRIRHRIGRFLVPWAIWFAIYGVKNVLADKPIIQTDHGIVSGILSGPSIHLWYMPFTFSCLIVFEIIKKHVPKISIACTSSIFAAIVLACTPAWRVESIRLGYPVEQYAHALSGVFLGAFFLYFDALPGRTGQLLLVTVIASALSAVPYEGVGIPYLFGIVSGCILVSRSLDKMLIVNLSALSQLTLGIYFVHIIVIRAIQRTFQFSGIVLPIAAFLVSALIVLVLRKSTPKLAKYFT
jgi:fucose 4-O-acetylase-like acetyltransferase